MIVDKQFCNGWNQLGCYIMAVEQDLLTLASQRSTNLTFDYPMDQRDVTLSILKWSLCLHYCMSFSWLYSFVKEARIGYYSIRLYRLLTCV